MKASEVLELIRAGYTKADIEQMNAEKPADDKPENPEQPKPAPANPAPENPEQKKPAEDKPANPEQPKPAYGNDIAVVLNEMQKTLQAIQSANVQGSRNPEPETVANAAASILAEVIAPPAKGRKDNK